MSLLSEYCLTLNALFTLLKKVLILVFLDERNFGFLFPNKIEKQLIFCSETVLIRPVMQQWKFKGTNGE